MYYRSMLEERPLVSAAGTLLLGDRISLIGGRVVEDLCEVMKALDGDLFSV